MMRLYAENDDCFPVDVLDIQTVDLEGGVKGLYNVKSVEAFIQKNRKPESWISIKKIELGKIKSQQGVFDLMDTYEFVMKGGVK
jgi:hypothetical protein